MLIAQITDVHIGFDPMDADEFNQRRLRAVLGALADGPNQPDLLLLTGDLADHGDVASYERLKQAMADCPYPWLPLVGNHDERANFHTVFPGYADGDGFVQYVRDCGDMRLVIVDTLDEGRHGGAFCAQRAAWLDARLAEAPETPTYIVMHHPPLTCGIEWMNTDPDEPWVQAFSAVLSGHPQVRGLICGHLHRSVTAAWQGRTVAICSSTAPQVTADFTPIDSERPDERAMIQAEEPAYALHRWNGRELVSFYMSAGAHPVLARYDAKMQPVVQHLEAERPA
jgi:Icc protein